MNILREIRKVKKRSVALRVTLILFFGSFLIINTLAWYNISKNVTTGNVGATVIPWDVEYYITSSDSPIEEVATFTINEIYPGMPTFEDYVFIKNMTTKNSKIEYKVKTITLFGEVIFSKDAAPATNQVVPNTSTIVVNQAKGIESGFITIININQYYPFEISCSYDKNILSGQYVSDVQTPDSVATFTMNIDWDYELLQNELVSTDRDNLDTDFAKRAYEYYEENNTTNALVIEVEINSYMI